MITISQAIRDAAIRMKESGVDNAEYDSFAMLSDITGISRTDYLVRGDCILETKDFLQFTEYVDRRCKREPLQHILGKAYFYGRCFDVNSNVLVPRPDTEILVEQALKYLKDGDSVLDMCTGSGCIIATLSLERQLLRAVGVDLSKEALVVARANVSKLRADVTFVHSDLFNELSDIYGRTFDMIVSNPPYIETRVINTLADEVKLFDPYIALDGYEDGLHFYSEISKDAKHYLKCDGWLIYEIGHNQADKVSDIMAVQGYKNIQVIKDYAGFDRVVMGQL